MVGAVAIASRYGPFDACANRFNAYIKVDVAPCRRLRGAHAKTMYQLLKVFRNLKVFLTPYKEIVSKWGVQKHKNPQQYH